MNVLLMGHPNVGKSVFFNRLTGASVTESNYPGTTIDYTKGYMRIGGKSVELIDVPGTFSLNPKDKAEEVAVAMLHESKDVKVICVIDASKIERGLFLALEIIEQGYPVVIALNMWDVARDKHIKINIDGLSRILGVAVVATTAISGEGIKDLVANLDDARPVEIDNIINNVGGLT
ncbi:MAG: ferrous iron transport protein B [Candidatus Methanomarinus sp.]|nr:MAG: ferrous iron transport protein B [ANME-2 cluster archaeon]